MKRYSQQQIGDLLDKFMNGLTTVEEEITLAEYFRTRKIPRQWEDYRLMFDYFDREMEGGVLNRQTSARGFRRIAALSRWGVAAAAIAAAIVTVTVLRTPEVTSPRPPVTAKVLPVDTPTVAVPEVITRPLAVDRPTKPAINDKASSKPSRIRLQAENERLVRENERLQRELEDLRRRAFIIDMEANGFKTVMGEDGRIVIVDLEQEIENELNHQSTNNIPEI